MKLETFDIDGKEYILIKEIEDENGNRYFYFKNDEVPLMVRKRDNFNTDYIIPLANTEEVVYAVSLLNNEL